MLSLVHLAPSGSPTNVNGTAVSSTIIQLSWDPPLSYLQNGLIQSYNITVLEVDTNTTLYITQDTSRSTISITDLHPHYTYKLSVAAYTVDIGPASSVYVTTLQDGRFAIIHV